MKIILTLFVLLFTSSMFAEELASWGITGSDCDDFFDFLEIEEGELIAKFSVQSFLTGYNTALGAERKFDDIKVLNHNTVEYIISYIKNSCIKANMDEAIYIILWEYFETLPVAK